jgi:hypothetical protein
VKGSRLVRTLLLAAALVGISCQWVLDVHRLTPEPNVDAEAGAPVDPCVHAGLPPPPGGVDVPSEGQDYWFAIQQIIIPAAEVDGVKPGIDLDQACTCERDLHDGAPPCETPSPSGVVCDFDGGIDDSFGQLSTVFSPFLTGGYDPASTTNSSIANGSQATLIYVSGYNGQANDPAIGGAIVMSGGLYDTAQCGGPELPIPDGGRIAHKPRWDGCDRWSPGVGTVQGLYPNRKTLVYAGYVSNYTIVVRPDLSNVAFLGRPVGVNGGVSVGKVIADDAGTFHLEGYIAGRFDANAAAAVVGTTDLTVGTGVNGERSPLCASQYWSQIAKQLCAVRDTVMDLNDAFKPGKACDAISATMGFVARRAEVSNDEYDPVFISLDCPADGGVACQ